MGLLDSLFPTPQPGGLLSDPDAGMAIAAGLLNARKGEGFQGMSQGVMQAMAMHRQNQLNERANRASDLQQLQGAWSFLRQQDIMKAAQADRMGLPIPPPNPALAEINARIVAAVNQGNMAGGMMGNMPSSAMPNAVPPAAPQDAPQVPQAPQVQQPSGPQMSTPQNPQFNVPPDPQVQAPRRLYPDAGGSSYMQWLQSDPTGGKYLEQLAKDRAPQNVRPGGSIAKLGPDDTYQAAFYSPQLGPGIMPQRDANGNLSSASPIPGYSDAVAGIKRATTGENYTNVPMGNGQTQYMTNAQYESLRRLGIQPPGQTPPPPGSPPATSQNFPLNVPPQVQASRDQGRAAILQNELQRVLANPDKNMTVQAQNIAALRKEIAALPQAGAPASGTLGVSPNPVAQAGAIVDAETGAKNRQNVMKDDYATMSAQNANAQTVISRLQTIKTLGPQAITGAQSDTRDFLNGLLSLAHIKGAEDAKTAGDLVDKNAAQIALAIGAGSQGTDALRSLALTANPGRHMTIESMQRAADSLIAPLQMTQAKTQLLTPHFTRGDQASYFGAKQAFESGADPRVWELQNLSGPAQKAYISNLSPADAQNLLAARQQLKQLGVIK